MPAEYDRKREPYDPDGELDAIVSRTEADATSWYYHSAMGEHFAMVHSEQMEQGWIRVSTDEGDIYRFALQPIALITLGVITQLAKGNMTDLGLGDKAIALEHTMANIIHLP